jgi:hypothetical protein
MAAPPPKAILAQRSHSSPSSAQTHFHSGARVTTHPHQSCGFGRESIRHSQVVSTVSAVDFHVLHQQ